MAQPFQAIGQGPGNPNRILNHLGAHRLNPNDPAPIRKVLLRVTNFHIRFSELTLFKIVRL